MGPERMMPASACRVLMVYPRFNANSFWNYQATCEIGRRAATRPRRSG